SAWITRAASRTASPSPGATPNRSSRWRTASPSSPACATWPRTGPRRRPRPSRPSAARTTPASRSSRGWRSLVQPLDDPPEPRQVLRPLDREAVVEEERRHRVDPHPIRLAHLRLDPLAIPSLDQIRRQRFRVETRILRRAPQRVERVEILRFRPVPAQQRRVHRLELAAVARVLRRLVRPPRRWDDLAPHHLQPFALGAPLERIVRILHPLPHIGRQRRPLGRRVGAQEERPPVDVQLDLAAQLLDLDETDVTPGSNEIRPDLHVDARHLSGASSM